MVRKLIKYDFRSFFRLIFPAQLILIGIAAINRIVQLFEPKEESFTYSSLFASSVTLYVISIFALVLVTLIVAMVRFYQGMYSNEGYLSHTLPVTPSQHILSKMLTGFIFEMGTLLTVYVSLNIITLGEVNLESYKAIGYLFKFMFDSVGAHGVLYILEAIALIIASGIGVLLMLYMCISIGQLVRKKKILLAVGVLFGLYVLGQIIGTAVIIVVSTFPEEVLESISKWIELHYIAFPHLLMCSGIVVNCIEALIFFFINKYIMKKKLNLT